jgi:hypothetical protein
MGRAIELENRTWEFWQEGVFKFTYRLKITKLVKNFGK